MSIDEQQSVIGALRGRLDSVDGRLAEGWAFNHLAPDTPVIVDVFADRQFLGSASAGVFRKDLLEAGLGNGCHCFHFLLPPDVADGAKLRVTARAQGASVELAGSPHILRRLPGPAPSAVHAITPIGMMDGISDEGWVQGWAWFPSAPDRRVEVEILVDGAVVGSTIATVHRQDLAAGGVGDGNYAFSLALPFEIVTQARESIVLAREKITGHVFASPRVYRRRALSDALAKVAALEDDVRLLRASLDRIGHRAQADERAAADLFRTVGDFFVRLAEASDAGKPAGALMTLSGAVERMGAQFAELVFEYPAEPQFSFCLFADGPVESLYNTLKVIHDLSRAIPSEVILIDDGACGEATLMPLVARNIRYLPLRGDLNPVVARNRSAADARGAFVIFLAAKTEPAGDWLAEVHTAFLADSDTAMLAANIQHLDGELNHAGIDMRSGDSMTLGIGGDCTADKFSRSSLVTTVASEAFAVRANIWRQMGGLDESFDNLYLAINDFCVRVVKAGGKILYQPAFALSLIDQSD